MLNKAESIQTEPGLSAPATVYAPPRPATSTSLTGMDGLLAMAMIIWGTHYVVIKAVLDILPLYIYNTLRFIIGAVALAVFIKLTGGTLSLPRREWRAIVGLSLISHVAYQVFFLNGLKNTTVANSVLIGTLAPVWVVLFNALRGRERVSRVAMFGVFLALAGAVVVVISRYAGQVALGESHILGDVLTLCASFVWMVATLASHGPLQRNPAPTVSFWVLVWGTVFTALLAAPEAAAMNWSVVPTGAILALFYSGIVAIGIAGTIWNAGIKRIGTSRTAIYINLQPIIATVAAAIFLGESLTIWLVVGTVFVLTGVWLAKRL